MIKLIYKKSLNPVICTHCGVGTDHYSLEEEGQVLLNPEDKDMFYEPVFGWKVRCHFCDSIFLVLPKGATISC